jgi:hypothetical protein
MTALPIAAWSPPAWLTLPLALLLGSPEVVAGPPVSSAQADFQRLHPCPANNARSGDCPGYVIDYVVPRCLGGPDDPYNMRWQTVAEVKARDAVAVRRCPATRSDGQLQVRLICEPRASSRNACKNESSVLTTRGSDALG